MNGWFASHAGIFELVLVEGLVLGLAFYELRSIRRTLKRDRSAASALNSRPADGTPAEAPPAVPDAGSATALPPSRPPGRP